MTTMKLGNITERDAGETCGSWKRPDWVADVRFFRCRGCRAVVPESLFASSNPALELCQYCDRHLVPERGGVR